ncbi:unnamed protein product [Peronospora farinosa]|uniref:Uncharacterized protein n=1 Tax=Peronospora farinosa TaxID=134698 RepID=A0AAV0U180_9STRA|nr:unnamed protein product [Peronospora farinosa]CAH0491566.1 unnamed protein product [Peronospora farinosa]CAI5728498.1 unnamed protein product [Peronospora farinosa]
MSDALFVDPSHQISGELIRLYVRHITKVSSPKIVCVEGAPDAKTVRTQSTQSSSRDATLSFCAPAVHGQFRPGPQCRGRVSPSPSSETAPQQVFVLLAPGPRTE